jgi:hypothetical protein
MRDFDTHMSILRSNLNNYLTNIVKKLSLQDSNNKVTTQEYDLLIRNILNNVDSK